MSDLEYDLMLEREEREETMKYYFELELKKKFKKRKEAACHLVKESQFRKLHWLESWFVLDFIEHPRRYWKTKGRTKFKPKEYRSFWYYQLTQEEGIPQGEAIKEIIRIEANQTGKVVDECSIRESIGLKK